MITTAASNRTFFVDAIALRVQLVRMTKDLQPLSAVIESMLERFDAHLRGSDR